MQRLKDNIHEAGKDTKKIIVRKKWKRKPDQRYSDSSFSAQVDDGMLKMCSGDVVW